MLITLIPLIFVVVAGYYLYTKFISQRLDCPRNNPNIKGLEKAEVKELVKETEQNKKDLEKEIKELQTKIKEETDKDQKQELSEQRADKIKELQKAEADLADLKMVEKDDYWSHIPNKLSINNVVWIVGFLIGLVILYKVCVAVFRSLFRAIGFEE